MISKTWLPLAAALLVVMGVRMSDGDAAAPGTFDSAIASVYSESAAGPQRLGGNGSESDYGVAEGVMVGTGQELGSAGKDAWQDDPRVWTASGLCAPAEVSTQMLRMAFDPSMVGALGGDAPTLAVAEASDELRIGDYTIELDRATETVSVTGPAGADALARDIRRCIAADAADDRADRVGTWEVDEASASWRYVDGDLVQVQLAPSAGSS